jgi:hypothetical protein
VDAFVRIRKKVFFPLVLSYALKHNKNVSSNEPDDLKTCESWNTANPGESGQARE